MAGAARGPVVRLEAKRADVVAGPVTSRGQRPVTQAARVIGERQPGPATTWTASVAPAWYRCLGGLAGCTDFARGRLRGGAASRLVRRPHGRRRARLPPAGRAARRSAAARRQQSCVCALRRT